VSTGANQNSEIAAHAQQLAEAVVARAEGFSASTRLVTEKIEYEDAFPFPEYALAKRRPTDWEDESATGVVELHYPNGAYMLGEPVVFKIGGVKVPDWTLGYVSFENRASLPEDGTIDEIKAAIVAVISDCVAMRAREIRDLLAHYNIETVEFSADFLNGNLTVSCWTQRSVMSVNGVMTNQRVRKGMTGRVTVKIDTYVESHRRTDDYLGAAKPPKQTVTRTFVYENKVLIRNEPEHWSAGSTYGNGDIVSVGSLRWRVGDDPLDSVPGFTVKRRPEARTDLSPGERAYAQAARNR
jgi:hypothetical protein